MKKGFVIFVILAGMGALAWLAFYDADDWQTIAGRTLKGDDVDKCFAAVSDGREAWRAKDAAAGEHAADLARWHCSANEWRDAAPIFCTSFGKGCDVSGG